MYQYSIEQWIYSLESQFNLSLSTLFFKGVYINEPSYY